MTPLFSEAGKAELDEIVKPGVICVFDFDGTLSPIVTRPDRARLPLAVKKRLLELSRLAPVGIITGRSLADIRPRLGFEPDYVVGNHGLEGVPGWESKSEAYADLCRGWKETLDAALQDRSTYDQGIRVEDKGYSLSMHYRLTRDHAAVRARLMQLFETLSPPARIVAGKCVFSLVPEDAVDKGMALEQLMHESDAKSAIYVGDDVTDEDVFALKRQDVVSVRIGLSNESSAKFFLSHRVQIVQLLDDLIRRLRVCSGANNRTALLA